MRSLNCSLTRNKRAFTLIELLVVIAIIAILAGLTLGAVMAAKGKAMTNKAKVDISNLSSAISQYQAEYGRPPVSQKVWDSSKSNARGAIQSPDFTYGTTTTNGTLLKAGLPTIVTYKYPPMPVPPPTPSYHAANDEIVAVLRGVGYNINYKSLASSLNSKKTSFLDAATGDNIVSPGIGTDGVYRDPWGNPYIISIDLDDSGTTLDGVYGFLRKDAGLNPEIPSPVAVWSLGPDENANQNGSLKSGFNKDNILSWAQ